jgi:hypothetical protein
MKKLILGFLALNVFPIVCEVVAQKELESAKVIRYSITIYRDDQTDKDAWAKVVDQTSDIIKMGEAPGNDIEFVQRVLGSIGAIPTRNLTNGIHGEIKIGIGDGVCVCNAPCDCAAQYNGLCPCSALKTDCKK